MAEWLRRVIRNHMGVARGSSNLSAVGALFVWLSTSTTFWSEPARRVLSSVVEHGIADPAVTGSIPVVPFG